MTQERVLRLDELSVAIRRINGGEAYIAPALAARVVTALRRSHQQQRVARVRFSPREEEVLLPRGGTNKEIADALTISEKTVKHSMTMVIQKRKVRNRVEVVLAQVVSDRMPPH